MSSIDKQLRKLLWKIGRVFQACSLLGARTVNWPWPPSRPAAWLGENVAHALGLGGAPQLHNDVAGATAGSTGREPSLRLQVSKCKGIGLTDAISDNFGSLA